MKMTVREIADGSNYRVEDEPGSETADGSNYREEDAEGSEIADGSNYQVQDEPGSEIADGSNYRDRPCDTQSLASAYGKSAACACQVPLRTT